jgi:hypothetical protein
VARTSGRAIKGQSQFVTAPLDWDRGYRIAQARNAAGGGPIRVWLQGHSIMSGHKATITATDCFRWLIRNFLVAKYGRSADFFPVTLSDHFNEMLGVGVGGPLTWTGGGAPPWLFSVSPLANAPLGFLFGNDRVGYVAGSPFAQRLPYSGMGGDCIWFNGPAAGTTVATFQHSAATWLENCQAYDVVAPNLTAGAVLTYNVNGAGANTITLTADQRIQIIQAATGLAAGRYDTVFKTSGLIASGSAWLSGVVAHATTRGAPGVQIAHLAANSAVLSNMDSKYISSTLLALDAATGTPGLGGFPLKPDLIISDMLLSDSGTYSPDVSTQRFAQFVEACRRANPYVSIIFLIDYNPNGVTTDSPAVFSYSFGYPTHVETLKAVADQLACSLVNIHDAWQGRGAASGYITSGDIHPLNPGHLAAFNLVSPLL